MGSILAALRKLLKAAAMGCRSCFRESASPRWPASVRSVLELPGQFVTVWTNRKSFKMNTCEV
jgi:hypothetical protein